jgi:hypothetical protein
LVLFFWATFDLSFLVVGKLPLPGPAFISLLVQRNRNKEIHRKWRPYGFLNLTWFSTALRNSLRSNSPRDYPVKDQAKFSHSFFMRHSKRLALRACAAPLSSMEIELSTTANGPPKRIGHINYMIEGVVGEDV